MAADDEVLLIVIAALPLLLVYLGAILGAILTWRRHPLASALALSGAVVLIVTFGLEYLWEFLLLDLFQLDAALDFLDFAVIWGAPLLRAFGTALLVGAIFVGRRAGTARQLGDDV